MKVFTDYERHGILEPKPDVKPYPKRGKIVTILPEKDKGFAGESAL
jgi:hypothetical protein